MANSFDTVTIPSSAGTLIIAANPKRRGLIVQNNGSAILFLGTTSVVTTSDGYPVLPRGQMAFERVFDGYRGQLYGISDGSDIDVRYLEWEE